MENGNYIVGEVVGFASEPWATDSTKVNHSVGIAAKYKDKFDQDKITTIEVSVSPKLLDKAKAAAEKLKGHRVALPVGVQSLVGGRKGAWTKYFLRDAEIVTV
jgi:hypothetical protein